jgi:hypothetical protein
MTFKRYATMSNSDRFRSLIELMNKTARKREQLAPGQRCFDSLTLSILAAGFLTFILATSVAYALPEEPGPSRYYVSPHGDNTTGLSYKTAWTDLDQIKYSVLKSADVVFIDGGASGITYHKPLLIPAGLTNVQFRNAVDPGHSGPVTIDGTGSTSADGIRVTGSYITVGGTGSWLPIPPPPPAAAPLPTATLPSQFLKVQNFSIGIQDLSSSATLGYLEVTGNKNGLSMEGESANVGASNIHDNTLNDIVDFANGTVNSYVGCWIHNLNYLPAGSIVPGMRLAGGTVNNCVIGPGLTHGIVTRTTSKSVTVSNCVLNDATVANFEVIAEPGDLGAMGPVLMDNCTSFMTNLNPYNATHSCLSTNYTYPYKTSGGGSGPPPPPPPPPALAIYTSIFYGGNVRVPAASSGVIATRDTEFNVTGNTMALATKQVDPLIQTNIAPYPNLSQYPNNVSIGVLEDTHFSLSPRSPALGTGSSLTSLYQLQSNYDLPILLPPPPP